MCVFRFKSNSEKIEEVIDEGVDRPSEEVIDEGIDSAVAGIFDKVVVLNTLEAKVRLEYILVTDKLEELLKKQKALKLVYERAERLSSKLSELLLS